MTFAGKGLKVTVKVMCQANAVGQTSIACSFVLLSGYSSIRIYDLVDRNYNYVTMLYNVKLYSCSPELVCFING